MFRHIPSRFEFKFFLFFPSLACVASSVSYLPTGRLSAVSAEKETGMAILPPFISPSIPLTIMMMINGGKRPVVQSVRESPFSRAVVSSIPCSFQQTLFYGSVVGHNSHRLTALYHHRPSNRPSTPLSFQSDSETDFALNIKCKEYPALDRQPFFSRSTTQTLLSLSRL